MYLKNVFYRMEKDRYISDLTNSLSYESFSKADIVIEAVFENIKIKHQVIKELEQVVPKHCIIATNTSAIPIAKISEGSSRPENVSNLFQLNVDNICFTFSIMQQLITKYCYNKLKLMETIIFLRIS